MQFDHVRALASARILKERGAARGVLWQRGMPKLVILCSPDASFIAEHSAQLSTLGVSLFVSSREDVVWAARQFSAAAVVVDTRAPVRSETDVIFALAQMSEGTGMPVIAMRAAFDDSMVCEAPRLAWVSENDGAEHVRDVVDAYLNAAELPAGESIHGALHSFVSLGD